MEGSWAFFLRQNQDGDDQETPLPHSLLPYSDSPQFSWRDARISLEMGRLGKDSNPAEGSIPAPGSAVRSLSVPCHCVSLPSLIKQDIFESQKVPQVAQPAVGNV